MDQKTIVLYLRMKEMSFNAIHEDLVRTLGTDAVTDSLVTKYARSAKFSPKKDRPSSEPSVVEPIPVDDAILATLADYPFLSIHELFRRTCLPRSTVHRHLTHSLRFTIRHLRCVPHLLTAEQKRIRVDRSVSSCASSRYRGRASGITSSLWTSHGSTCSMNTI
jgi:hypothetical protein